MVKTIVICLIIFTLPMMDRQGICQPYYKYVDKDGVIHFTDTPTDRKFLSSKQSNSNLPSAPRISLDCKDLDIRVVINWISKAWNVHILVADDVQGIVTIRRANTPADKILDEILSMNNLVRFQEEGIIIVAKASNARQIQEALQTEIEKRKLMIRIKNLSEFYLKDSGFHFYRKEAIIEALQIMNSAELNGGATNSEFIRTMKEFVDAIEDKNQKPYMLELLSNKARALIGQPAPIRPKPTHISPPPVVNVFR